MTTRRQSGNSILNAEIELESAQHSYLRSHGWAYTSETPGCHWLWRKTTPKGETLLVNTQLAIAIQQSSCAIRGNEW